MVPVIFLMKLCIIFSYSFGFLFVMLATTLKAFALDSFEKHLTDYLCSYSEK
jgi:hypothetical protein